jgi:membrane protein implicated in regulation of membrane protease activity
VIGRIFGFALGVVLFAVALVFASVLALVAGVVVIVLWIYLSWRMRALQKEARRGGQSGTVVIEGDYRVERDDQTIDVQPVEPHDPGSGRPR